MGVSVLERSNPNELRARFDLKLAGNKYDRDGLGRHFGRPAPGGPPLVKIRCTRRGAKFAARDGNRSKRPSAQTIFDRNIATFDIDGLLEALSNSSDLSIIELGAEE